MLEQAEAVGMRLRRHRLFAGGVTVKIRYGDFKTITRSQGADESGRTRQRRSVRRGRRAC